MAVTQSLAEPVYRCPRCAGSLTVEHGSWRCDDCGHVPNHGSD